MRIDRNGPCARDHRSTGAVEAALAKRLAYVGPTSVAKPANWYAQGGAFLRFRLATGCKAAADTARSQLDDAQGSSACVPNSGGLCRAGRRRGRGSACDAGGTGQVVAAGQTVVKNLWRMPACARRPSRSETLRTDLARPARAPALCRTGKAAPCCGKLSDYADPVTEHSRPIRTGGAAANAPPWATCLHLLPDFQPTAGQQSLLLARSSTTGQVVRGSWVIDRRSSTVPPGGAVRVRAVGE